MHKFVLAAAAIFTVVAATPVSASDALGDGFYAGVRPFFSLTRTDDPTLNNPPVAGTIDFKNDDFEANGGLGGVLGFGWGEIPVRTEFEFDWRVRHDTNVRLLTPPTFGIDYSTNLWSLTGMVNVLYDIRLGGRLTPYVGGGAGWSYNVADTDLSNANTGFMENNENGEGSFAWNAQAGFLYDWSENFALQLGYRYNDLGDAESDVFSTGESIDIDGYRSHDVLFGALFSF